MKYSGRVKVKNPMGLHTRPATEIVKLLQKYTSSVFFTYRKETINARSILGILMLAVGRNSSLTITVEGEDAEEVFKVLTREFALGFGE